MRVRIILGGALLLAALLGTVVLAPAAGAAAVNADPAGDGHGPGDLRAQRVSFSGSDVVFQVRTQRGLNLANAPAWADGANTQLRINIDSQQNPAVDYAIVIEPGPSGVAASLLIFGDLPSPRISCEPTVTQPGPGLIRAAVPSGCFNAPAFFRAFSRYRLDRSGDGSVNSDDRAPDAGWGPKLVVA